MGRIRVMTDNGNGDVHTANRATTAMMSVSSAETSSGGLRREQPDLPRL
jgi:hypothetical protein